MLVTRDKLTFCVGMQWSIAENQATLRKLKRSAARKCTVSVDLGDEGLLFGVCPDRCRGRIYSLSVLAASVYGEGLFVIPVGDDQTWVCLAQKGVPVAGRERICSASEVFGVLEDWISFHGHVSLVGEAQGATADTDAFWSQMVEAARDVDGKLALLSGDRTPLLILSMVLGVAIGAGAWFWVRSIQTEDAPVPLQEEEIPVGPSVTDDERQRAIDAVTSRYQGAITRQTQMASQLALSNARWSDAISAVPQVAHGYRLVGAACESRACTLTWERLPGARVSDRFRLPGMLIRSPVVNPDQPVTTQIPVVETSARRSEGALHSDQPDDDEQWVASMYDQLMLPELIVALHPVEQEHVNLPGRGDVPLYSAVSFDIQIPGSISIAFEPEITSLITRLGGTIDRYEREMKSDNHFVMLSGRFIRLAAPVTMPTIGWDNDALKVTVDGVAVDFAIEENPEEGLDEVPPQ